jgi:hypothetical protein
LTSPLLKKNIESSKAKRNKKQKRGKRGFLKILSNISIE